MIAKLSAHHELLPKPAGISLAGAARSIAGRLVMAFFVCAGLPVEGRFYRVNLVPNGAVFSCNTCHDIGGGGPRNLFGAVVEEVAVGSAPFWDVALALLDSDGDGFTNGEELGDPDGDGVPEPGRIISNPGDPLSFPPTPPALSIPEPSTGALYQEGETVRARAEADDAEGIQWVRFEWRRARMEALGALVLTDNTSPYEGIWRLTAGEWNLQVIAADLKGSLSVLRVTGLRVAAGEPLRLAPPRLESSTTNSRRWRFTWSGGAGPFALQRAAIQPSNRGWLWREVTKIQGRTAVWDDDAADASFFRVIDTGLEDVTGPGAPP